MLTMCFWLFLAVVFYTYLGYGVVVWAGARLARGRARPCLPPFEPAVTLVVTAYNEVDGLEAKILNCLAQDYPAGKLHLLFITDGSYDNSGTVLARFPAVWHLHQSRRASKAMTENRAMRHVQTPFVVFTDCNTLLNPGAVRALVRHYADPRVGAVSGERRVLTDNRASGPGQRLYWRYESLLKRCGSDIHSLMGTAGELVSFRTALFRPLEADTILGDFIQSMRIVEAGYRVVYEPRAYALEPPPYSLKEELERMVRICAGGWQAMSRLPGLLRPWRQPVVSFLYLSHRVLRWSLTPLLLVLLLPLNATLAATKGGPYALLLALQAGFYAAAAAGGLLAAWGRPAGPLVGPLYFTLLNVAAFGGCRRFVSRTQPAACKKARRTVALG